VSVLLLSYNDIIICPHAASEFGAKIVLPKRILKILPELFDHQDQNVRASSKRLTFELFRWVCKDDVKSILFEKMRDTMVSLSGPLSD
jgi:cytoskeleton-associated protein 5